MSYQLIRGDACHIPLADDSVDLICTSPPYFALRSYTDGGEHYSGQIGSEATPQAFLEALWAVTAECRRVLKPSGSLWVNLGDKYSGYSGKNWGHGRDLTGERSDSLVPIEGPVSAPTVYGIPNKSLMLLPQRYAIGCIDQLGLICRAEIIWAKPNGLPESVTDRVRRSHEQWFHFTRQGRYFSAVDEVREPQDSLGKGRPFSHEVDGSVPTWGTEQGAQGLKGRRTTDQMNALNPLGKLPGSVWTDDDGTPLSTMGAVLNAVKDGYLTPEEGERILWDSRNSGSVSCPMCGKPKAAAGSGSGGRITVATAKPQPSEVADARTGHTESHTNFSSDPSPTDSTSTTSAATSPASTRHTSKRSPNAKTSDGKPKPTDPPIAPRATSSSTPTSTATPASAAPASRSVCECDAYGLPSETVWSVPTEPLRVPEWLGVDHFAAFPSSFPRRIILGWSPSGVCVACGEGRRPVVAKDQIGGRIRTHADTPALGAGRKPSGHMAPGALSGFTTEATITGYACACPDTTAPTRPAVILDPFTGTGTVPAVAHILGRHGIGVDLSADYLRLAEWRCNDPALRAKVLGVDKPRPVPDGQGSLFGDAA